MFIKNSISLKLLKKVFFIYFVITFIMTIAQILIEYYDTKSQVQHELLSLENTYMNSLRNAVWDMNVDQIESLTDSISKLSFVKEVILLDTSGNVMSHKKEENISNRFSHTFNIYKKQETSNVIIARVIISSDRESVINIVKTGVILIILNAMIKSVLLLFLFIWAFQKTLVEPLTELTNQIDKIEFDNLNQRKISVNAPKNSELDLLQKKFNLMVEKLDYQKNAILQAEHDYAAKLEREVKMRTSELEKSNSELERMATTDYLTGVKNRRSFYEASEQSFLIAQRQFMPLSILMCDIDHFKLVNDEYGHHVGDIALKEFARKCEETLRKSDIFGRVGGEEFAITLFNSTIENAKILAEKIVYTTSQILVNDTISFTVSIGVAQMFPTDHQLSDIITRADKALYEAKANGRNQVVVN